MRFLFFMFWSERAGDPAGLAAGGQVVFFLSICAGGYVYILNDLGLLTGGYRGRSQSAPFPHASDIVQFRQNSPF